MTHWHPSRRTVLLGAAAGLFAAPRRVVAASGEPIRIGHQCDVTGGLASSGYWHRKTINVAAEWFNANGGFGGRPIEVIGIDTETKVDVGIARLRQLIQDQKVDFVIGSQHGGVALASTAIVRDEGVPYMSTSRSEGVTEGSGNPFVFRLIVNTRQTDLAAGKAMAEMVGKRRAVLYADYVWGQSHNTGWTEAITAAGGKVAQSIALPLNSNDPISYISKLDRSVDGIFVALIGTDLPKAFVALPQLGFTRKPIVTADFVFGAFDPLSNGKYVEGVWGIDTLPWELADKDTPHLRAFRKRLGIDPNGRAGRFRSGLRGRLGHRHRIRHGLARHRMEHHDAPAHRRGDLHGRLVGHDVDEGESSSTISPIFTCHAVTSAAAMPSPMSGSLKEIRPIFSPPSRAGAPRRRATRSGNSTIRGRADKACPNRSRAAREPPGDGSSAPARARTTRRQSRRCASPRGRPRSARSSSPRRRWFRGPPA